MLGGRRVVPSWMVVENGAIGFACTFFLFRRYGRSEHGAWTRATAYASHSVREPQHWQKEGGAAFLGRWFGGQLSYSLDEYGMDAMVLRFVGRIADLWQIFKAVIPKVA